MNKLFLSDVTLKNSVQDKQTFREKLEYVLSLDELKVDSIELPFPLDKSDALLIKTAAEQVKYSTLICDVGQTDESIATAWESVKDAKSPVLQITLPVSPVQIEYYCHVKPPKLLENAVSLVEKCKKLCDKIEFKALDAFRADVDFLAELFGSLKNAGITSLVLVDGEGNLPVDEFSAFLKSLSEKASMDGISLAIQTNDDFGLGYANMLSAVKLGVKTVKTAVYGSSYTNLDRTYNLLSSSLKANLNIDPTKVLATVEKIRNYSKIQKSENSPFEFGVKEDSGLTLDKNATVDEVQKAATKLGYDLSDEDMILIYESFKRIADKKSYIGARELEVIIANASLQVPQTYRLISYVINSGNLITPTAVVKLEKDGQQIMGLSVGDGPVDAGILAIENAIGCHYELDDYQITAVTEGREAMGSAIVKLRAYGKIFSGTGLSTDVIGASIRAYVSAINKIAFEEN